jgi:hypothetical protein
MADYESHPRRFASMQPVRLKILRRPQGEAMFSHSLDPKQTFNVVL